jgi:hypothetical protein
VDFQILLFSDFRKSSRFALARSGGFSRRLRGRVFRFQANLKFDFHSLIILFFSSPRLAAQ